jgi:ribosomal protein L7/L12
MNIEVFYNRPAATGQVTLHDLTEEQVRLCSDFAHAVMFGKQPETVSREESVVAVKQAQFEAARVLLEYIRQSLDNDHFSKIWAIEAVRAVTNLDLRSAKDMVELYLPNSLNITKKHSIDSVVASATVKK